MDIQKYKDMAIGNPQGVRWLQAVQVPRIWNKFIKIFPTNSTEEFAKYALIEMIWFYGYSRDVYNRVLKRMHLHGSRSNSAGNFPLEFILIDNFFEREVRDILYHLDEEEKPLNKLSE